jgi:hypothetical protein
MARPGPGTLVRCPDPCADPCPDLRPRPTNLVDRAPPPTG